MKSLCWVMSWSARSGWHWGYIVGVVDDCVLEKVDELVEREEIYESVGVKGG